MKISKKAWVIKAKRLESEHRRIQKRAHKEFVNGTEDLPWQHYNAASARCDRISRVHERADNLDSRDLYKELARGFNFTTEFYSSVA